MEAAMSEQTLEQGFERLEQITRKMETGDLPLEEMYALYKEGIALVQACGKKIDTVEKNMQMLDAEGNLTDLT